MLGYRFGVVVLTYNAGPSFTEWVQALKCQSVQPDIIKVVDSSSVDHTATLAKETGCSVTVIPQKNVNHGGTRQTAFKALSNVDLIVYLTQDAFLADRQSLENLVNAFRDESIGAAYGRQLPQKGATPIEAHARIFNYPPESHIKGMADKSEFGIKTCFMSNSFAAYRCSALQQVGSFPENNIVSEDTYVAAKILEAGWQIKYCADATVYHSHNYTITQEFQRYFDLGVFHSREPWIRSRFGQAEGEGKLFVHSQLTFLMKEHFFLMPSALLRTAFKYLGFRLGFCEAYLPNKLKIWLSMQKHFWMK